MIATRPELTDARKWMADTLLFVTIVMLDAGMFLWALSMWKSQMPRPVRVEAAAVLQDGSIDFQR